MSRCVWRSSSAPPRSPQLLTPPSLRSALTWWSRCAQKHMWEQPPTFLATQLLDLSLVPLLDPAGGVRPMLMPMPSSMEVSPLLTTLPPLQATLSELLAPLPPWQLLLPLVMLLLLLPSATLLHLLLLLLPHLLPLLLLLLL